MATKIKIGSRTLTVNHGPASFLIGVVILAVLSAALLPDGKAELLLAPTGILALVAQALMREAFKVESATPAVAVADEGKPEP